MKKYDVVDFDDFEEEDALSDEELDEMYRPKKMNNRKSLLPLFVYKIMEGKEGYHFSQSELIERLADYPYEINVERKALSRVLHGLADSGMGIMSTSKRGCWYDSNEVWN